MKKIILSLLFVPFFTNAQENVISNGGFEDWDTTPSGWEIENTVEKNSTDVFEGVNSAKLSIVDKYKAPKILAKVPLEKDVNYTVSYRFKYLDSNYSGGNPISLKLIKNGSATNTTKSSFAINNNWKEVTIEFMPDTTGDYDLSIYLYSFDNETFNVLIDDVKVIGENTAGIDNVEVNDVISFYPNPVKDKLRVKSIHNVGTIKIYNSLGKNVLTSAGENIDLSSLSSGVYYLKVTINNKTFTKKIIKE